MAGWRRPHHDVCMRSEELTLYVKVRLSSLTSSMAFETYCLWDSGASCPLISEDMLKKLGIEDQVTPDRRTFRTASSRGLEIIGFVMLTLTIMDPNLYPYQANQHLRMAVKFSVTNRRVLDGYPILGGGFTHSDDYVRYQTPHYAVIWPSRRVKIENKSGKTHARLYFFKKRTADNERSGYEAERRPDPVFLETVQQ